MIIQLALVLSLFTIHLRHLFQTIEHGLNDPFIRGVHIPSDLKTVGAPKLTFNTIHVNGEMLDEMSHASSFLRVQLCLFDTLYLVILESNQNLSQRIIEYLSKKSRTT